MGLVAQQEPFWALWADRYYVISDDASAFHIMKRQTAFIEFLNKCIYIHIWDRNTHDSFKAGFIFKPVSLYESHIVSILVHKMNNPSRIPTGDPRGPWNRKVPEGWPTWNNDYGHHIISVRTHACTYSYVTVCFNIIMYYNLKNQKRRVRQTKQGPN